MANIMLLLTSSQRMNMLDIFTFTKQKYKIQKNMGNGFIYAENNYVMKAFALIVSRNLLMRKEFAVLRA